MGNTKINKISFFLNLGKFYGNNRPTSFLKGIIILVIGEDFLDLTSKLKATKRKPKQMKLHQAKRQRKPPMK